MRSGRFKRKGKSGNDVFVCSILQVMEEICKTRKSGSEPPHASHYQCISGTIGEAHPMIVQKPALLKSTAGCLPSSNHIHN